MEYNHFTFGLSRLEAEELASDSKEWLTFCLDPNEGTADSGYAYRSHII